jgi:hypothetical protein
MRVMGLKATTGDNMRKTLITAALASAALAATAATMPADATGGGDQSARGIPVAYPVVADNLHNPRQITFSHGDMYVAEAGSGSFDGTSSTGPCMVGGEGATVCYGRTGSVTRVRDGHQRRVLTGISSLGGKVDGGSALGPADLAVVGKHTVVLSVGFGLPPGKRRHLPVRGQKQMAHLLSFNLRSGKAASLGDLGRHEKKANPVANPDTDPTGVAKAGRLGYLVTDSGGNTVVSAKAGKVKSVAAFQNRMGISPLTGPNPTSYQSVPTDIVKGPDGAWYVSELTGFPFIQGASRVWRVVPGHKPHVWAKGLTNVTSLAFDGKKLYAVQISNEGLAATGPIGSLVRVFPKSSGKDAVSVSTDLFAPYGVAIRRGAAYVSTGAVAASGGSVLRIPLG